MSLESTASVVAPSGIRGLRFLDEADSINATVKELKEKGVKTIIVLIHIKEEVRRGCRAKAGTSQARSYI